MFDFATDRPFSIEATPWNFYLDSALTRIDEITELHQRHGVLILREPMSRSVSMFYDQQGSGLETRSINVAFEAELEMEWDQQFVDLDEDLRRSYLRTSMYSARLEVARQYFPELTVIFFDTLRDAPAEVASRLHSEFGIRLGPPIGGSNRRSRERLPVSRIIRSVSDAIPDSVRTSVVRSRAMPKIRAGMGLAIDTVSRGVANSEPEKLSDELATEIKRRYAIDTTRLCAASGIEVPWASSYPI
ncbi:MAG: hypothetical protein ACRBK7_03270 [Acidimicrobiales bacterium]